MRVPIPPINKLIHLNTFSLQSLASFTLNFYFLFLLPSSKHSHEDRKTGTNMRDNNLDRSFQEGFLSPNCPPQPPHSCQPVPLHLFNTLKFLMPTHPTLIFYSCMYFPVSPLLFFHSQPLPLIHSVKFTISACRQN